MAEAKRDDNFVPTLLGVSSVDGVTPVDIWADPTTHRLLVDLPGAGSGDVVGPGSSTDNAVARFDSTTGKLLQNSVVIIDDSGNITGTGTVDGRDLAADGDLMVTTAGTGLVTGGVLSINVDTTKFDISDGHGYILDHTSDPANPTYTKVTWTGLTAQTVTNIATQDSTEIAINVSSAVVQQLAGFDENDRRNFIILGGITHVDNVNVDSAFARTSPSFGVNTSLSDLASSLGFINLTGNVYSANGANLNINKTAGTTFAYGENIHTDPEDPHTLINAVGTALSFLPAYRDGSGGTTFAASTPTIDPNNWDDGTGVLNTVSANKWTIQRLFMYPNTTTTVVVYGQLEYNSLAAAQTGVNEDVVTDIVGVTEAAAFRGWLILKVSETALNSSDTVFVSAGKFGEISESGLTTATTTLQQAYDNSTTPEILTDTTRGALSIKRGSAADTDDVVEVLNNADGQVMAITGEGDMDLAASGSISFNNVTILQDASGTTTLQNVDALDATTETTIEAAIDTLPNLTSIQSLTVTLADAGADAIFGWDDTTGAYENLTQAEVIAVIGDASLTAKGVIEIATVAETNTGTDATRAVSPDGLDGWTGSAQVVTVGTLASGDADAIVSAASVTVAGKVELATTAEIDTGTDSTRAIPVDQFVASDRNIRFIAIRLIEAATDVAIDTSIGGDFVMPFTGTLIQSDTDKTFWSAATDTAGTTGTMIVDVHKGGTTVMTTNKLDIETTEKSTVDATTQPDLTTTAVTAGDIFTFDIDAIHTTAAKGLTVYMAIRMT